MASKKAAAKGKEKKKTKSAGPTTKALKKLFTALGDADAFLGHARAVVIVCGCANTSPANLSRTLQELGVAGGPFQVCVANGVDAAGYRIAPEAIPNGPTTKLIEVVNVIQNAPRRAQE